jgi:hypothetical protein
MHPFGARSLETAVHLERIWLRNGQLVVLPRFKVFAHGAADEHSLARGNVENRHELTPTYLPRLSPDLLRLPFYHMPLRMKTSELCSGYAENHPSPHNLAVVGCDQRSGMNPWWRGFDGMLQV